MSTQKNTSQSVEQMHNSRKLSASICNKLNLMTYNEIEELSKRPQIYTAKMFLDKKNKLIDSITASILKNKEKIEQLKEQQKKNDEDYSKRRGVINTEQMNLNSNNRQLEAELHKLTTPNENVPKVENKATVPQEENKAPVNVPQVENKAHVPVPQVEIKDDDEPPAKKQIVDV